MNKTNMIAMPVFHLSNGTDMPQAGFGVYKVSPLLAKNTVKQALETGWRLIDTAEAYGNEKEVGEAIRESGLRREDIFLTTKIWRNIGEETAEEDFHNSLKALGTDYVDLCLIHMPYGDLYGTWRMLEREYQKGTVRAIGVSNFDRIRLTDLLVNTEIPPMVNQYESNPLHPANELISFCQDHNILFQAWGPLGQGRRELMESPVLHAMAEAYGKSPAQLLLRYGLQRGISVIAKSTHVERMKQNLEIFDFTIRDEDMKKLSSLEIKEESFLENPDFVQMLCGKWR